MRPLLGTVAGRLEPRFDQLRGGQADAPTPPGPWLDRFSQEMRSRLLAELDLRVQVVIDADGAIESPTPVWAVFGDLMSGLLGAFVLILLFALASQLELVTRLQDEIRQHQLEEQRRAELGRALAVPLAAGRVTIDHGRIDINGAVLFAFNSAELQPDGRTLLKKLAAPIADRHARLDRGRRAVCRHLRRRVRRRAAGGRQRPCPRAV